jgi:hypothetical protein
VEDAPRAVERAANSIRWLVRRHRVSLRTVMRVLHDQLLCALHVQDIQTLETVAELREAAAAGCTASTPSPPSAADG